MEQYPDIRLSHLRRIGWRHWNPLGIVLPEENAWRHINIAEYDNHLLHVACCLAKGGAAADAIAYLKTAARDYQSMSAIDECDLSAEAETVRALSDLLAGRM